MLLQAALHAQHQEVHERLRHCVLRRRKLLVRGLLWLSSADQGEDSAEAAAPAAVHTNEEDGGACRLCTWRFARTMSK